MDGSSNKPNNPGRHRGRPPGTHAFSSIEEKETFFNYIRYVIVYDRALEVTRILSPRAKFTGEAAERLLHQQTQARQEILAIIRKPGGIAEKIYNQEVRRLYEYCDKTIIPNVRIFEDKMYAKIYPKYMDTMGHAIFWNVAERIYGGKDAPSGAQPYVSSHGHMGMRSRESRAYIKLASLLRSYISTLANQDKIELGLTNSAGRFSPPSGQSNWRHNETISIDSKAVTDQGELESLAGTLPGSSLEQPEVAFEEAENIIAIHFPSDLKEHIRGILIFLAMDYRETDIRTLSEDVLLTDVKLRVDNYARGRIQVCEQLGDQSDAAYWEDEELLKRLTKKITESIIAWQKT